MASSLFLGYPNTTTVSTQGAVSGDGSSGDPLTVAVDGTTVTDAGGNLAVVADLTLTSVTSSYKSSDGTAGVSAGPFTIITGIRAKNGIITTLTGS